MVSMHQSFISSASPHPSILVIVVHLLTIRNAERRRALRLEEMCEDHRREGRYGTDPSLRGTNNVGEE